jgi:hypothetical protein
MDKNEPAPRRKKSFLFCFSLVENGTWLDHLSLAVFLGRNKLDQVKSSAIKFFGAKSDDHGYSIPRDCRRGILVVLVYHPAAEEPAQSSILILAVYFILYGPPTPGRHKYISLYTARLRVEQISNISGWEEEEEVPVPVSNDY